MNDVVGSEELTIYLQSSMALKGAAPKRGSSVYYQKYQV